MASFSISDAAFAGFRMIRARPQVVLIWAVILFVVSLGTNAAMSATAGPALMQMQSVNAQPSGDPSQTLALFRQILPMYAVLAPISLIYYGVLYATLNRAILRPQDSAFAYLRLGADEFRQIGLMLLYGVVAIGAYVAALLVTGVLTMVIVAIFAGGGQTGMAAGSFLAIAVAVIGMAVGATYLGVRLSLASAETFATRKIVLFGSWGLSRGHFWPMLGTYFIATALAFVVLMLGVTIAAALMAVVGGVDSLGSLVRPDLGTIASTLAPTRLIYMAVMAVISALALPVMFTPAATIYRALKGDGSGIDGVFE